MQNVDILDEEWKRDSLREFFVFNETGFMTAKTFEIVMDKVGKLWDELHKGVILFLLGDGCSAHTCEPDLVLKMHQKGKNVLFLPPNTTHFTQPLDSFPFGSFKLKVYKLLEEKQMISFLAGEKPSRSTVPEGQDAAKETLTPEKITAGFRETGIWPWNSEIMRKNVIRDIGSLDVSMVEKTAVTLCTEFIKDSKSKLEEKKKRRVILKASVKMNYIMDRDDILELKKVQAEIAIQEEQCNNKGLIRKEREKRSRSRRIMKRKPNLQRGKDALARGPVANTASRTPDG